MNAAETSASSAIADWTPLAVVSRSWTTAEIETFISDVSTTSTNIAIAGRIARRWLPFDSPAPPGILPSTATPAEPGAFRTKAHHPKRTTLQRESRPREGERHGRLVIRNYAAVAKPDFEQVAATKKASPSGDGKGLSPKGTVPWAALGPPPADGTDPVGSVPAFHARPALCSCA